MMPFWPLYICLGIVDLLVLMMARDIVFAPNVTRTIKVVFACMSALAVLLSIAIIRTLELLYHAIALGP